jgi:hypothetical protein
MLHYRIALSGFDAGAFVMVVKLGGHLIMLRLDCPIYDLSNSMSIPGRN